MSGRILLLRSGSAGSEDAQASDVTVLYTHTVVPRPEGIAEALAFDALGATLVISSKETVNYLLPLFRAPFAQMLAVGQGTGELLRKVNTGGEAGRLGEASNDSGETAPPVIVPEVPGAAGVIHFLSNSSVPSLMRILWPHGSDAAPEPLEQVRALGIRLVAPVVYDKRPLSSAELNPSILADFRAGRFGAVAVGSTAGLDVLLAALALKPAPTPKVRWGALGPQTAKAVTARGLPRPSIPAHARVAELLDLLRKETR